MVREDHKILKLGCADGLMIYVFWKEGGENFFDFCGYTHGNFCESLALEPISMSPLDFIWAMGLERAWMNTSHDEVIHQSFKRQGDQLQLKFPDVPAMNPIKIELKMELKAQALNFVLANCWLLRRLANYVID